MHQTAHPVFFRLTHHFLHLLETLVLLIEDALVPIVRDFEFLVLDALCLEQIRYFRGAVNNKPELVDDQKLKVLD